MPNPREFFKTTFVELFNRGIAELQAAADAGDAKAKSDLEDSSAAYGTLFVDLGGNERVYVSFEQGAAKAFDAPPASVPVRMAIGIDAEHLEKGLEELERLGAWKHPKAARVIARLASKRLETVLGPEKIDFHFVVLDTPDFDEVRLKASINGTEPPEKPRFTATVQFDDLEAARTGKLPPQQLLMGGKLKLTGDASRAMALGMQIMQMAQQKR